MKLETGYSAIWRVAAPVILGGVSQTIINVTDTLFLGRLSETALAASAIGGVLVIVLNMLGMGFTQGMQIIIARKAGEGRDREIGSVYRNGGFIVLLLSFILLFFLLVWVDPLLSLLIRDKQILAALLTFLHHRAPGVVFSLLVLHSRSLLIGMGRTGAIGWIMAIMATTNVLFNGVLVFGYHGFPAMGIAGSALASSIAECIGAIAFLGFLLRDRQLRQLNLFRFEKPQKIFLVQLSNISLPIVFQYFCSLAGWLVFFIVIEKTGQRNLAVSNVLRSLLFVMMTPVWGFFAAANSMVSNVIGQGRNEEVMPLIGRICLLSLAIAVTLSALGFIFPEPIISLFSSDKSLIAEAVLPLFTICAAAILFSVGGIFLGAVSGTGNTRAAMFIEVIAVTGYLLYLFYIHSIPGASISFYWTTEGFYWLLNGTMSFMYLRSNRWIGRKI